MRILYSAIDQSVPGAHGGSVHVVSVAEGLAKLGHELHVLVSPASSPPRAHDNVTWYNVPPPFGVRQLRFVRAPEVIRLARALKPDVVMERYYNFGGEGVLAARIVGATAVLEVNARVADVPGSLKRRSSTERLWSSRFAVGVIGSAHKPLSSSHRVKKSFLRTCRARGSCVRIAGPTSICFIPQPPATCRSPRNPATRS